MNVELLLSLYFVGMFVDWVFQSNWVVLNNIFYIVRYSCHHRFQNPGKMYYAAKRYDERANWGLRSVWVHAHRH